MTISSLVGGAISTVGSDRTVATSADASIGVSDMINYFSIGLDAKISYDFARHRKKSQFWNQFEYFMQGTYKTFNPTPKLLSARIGARAAPTPGPTRRALCC